MDTLKQHLYITKSHHGDGIHVVISLVQPTTVVNGREYAEVSPTSCLEIGHKRILPTEHRRNSSHSIWGSHPVANTPFFLAYVVVPLPPRYTWFRAIQITPRTDLPLLSFRLVRSGLFNTPSSWCRFIPSSRWELVTLGTTRDHLHEISRVNPGVLKQPPPCI